MTCNLTTSWQRFALTEVAGAQPASAGLWIQKSSGDQIHAFGAQFVIASWEGPYQQTVAAATTSAGIRNKPPATQNLILRSEEFDHASWGVTGGVTVAPNDVLAPDGTLTADKLTFAGGNSSYHLQLVSGLVAGRTYTFSVWLYTGTKVNVALVIRGNTTNTPLAGGVATLTAGWNRYSLTSTLLEGNSGAWIGFENRTFAGADGLAGYLYAWGAQLVQANWEGAYTPTTSAVVNTGNIRNLIV